MVSALSGAARIECQHSQPQQMNTRQLCPLHVSSMFWLLPHLLCCVLKWKEIKAITHKSISTDLIMHNRPHYIIFTAIISRTQRHIRDFSLFMINQRNFRLKVLYLMSLNKCVIAGAENLFPLFLRFHHSIFFILCIRNMTCDLMVVCSRWSFSFFFFFFWVASDVLKASHSVGWSDSRVWNMQNFCNPSQGLISRLMNQSIDGGVISGRSAIDTFVSLLFIWPQIEVSALREGWYVTRGRLICCVVLAVQEKMFKVIEILQL